jgi:hypothetical protein
MLPCVGDRLYIGWRVGQEQKADFLHANAFVELIQRDEKEFISALEAVTARWEPKEIEMAIQSYGSIRESRRMEHKVGAVRSGRSRKESRRPQTVATGASEHGLQAASSCESSNENGNDISQTVHRYGDFGTHTKPIK